MTDMKIQDGFGLVTTQRSLPMALLRAREKVMARFRPLLIQYDVTEQQWRVLRLIQETDELDASQIADKAFILAPSLSRIIKTLEAKGLISVRKDPVDGRRALIGMTAAGHAFVAEVAPESARIYDLIEARVGRDRIKTLLDEVDALVAALSEDKA